MNSLGNKVNQYVDDGGQHLNKIESTVSEQQEQLFINRTYVKHYDLTTKLKRAEIERVKEEIAKTKAEIEQFELWSKEMDHSNIIARAVLAQDEETCSYLREMLVMKNEENKRLEEKNREISEKCRRECELLKIQREANDPFRQQLEQGRKRIRQLNFGIGLAKNALEEEKKKRSLLSALRKKMFISSIVNLVKAVVDYKRNENLAKEVEIERAKNKSLLEEFSRIKIQQKEKEKCKFMEEKIFKPMEFELPKFEHFRTEQDCHTAQPSGVPKIGEVLLETLKRPLNQTNTLPRKKSCTELPKVKILAVQTVYKGSDMPSIPRQNQNQGTPMKSSPFFNKLSGKIDKPNSASQESAPKNAEVVFKRPITPARDTSQQQREESLPADVGVEKPKDFPEEIDVRSRNKNILREVNQPNKQQNEKEKRTPMKEKIFKPIEVELPNFVPSRGVPTNTGAVFKRPITPSPIQQIHPQFPTQKNDDSTKILQQKPSEEETQQQHEESLSTDVSIEKDSDFNISDFRSNDVTIPMDRNASFSIYCEDQPYPLTSQPSVSDAEPFYNSQYNFSPPYNQSLINGIDSEMDESNNNPSQVTENNWSFQFGQSTSDNYFSMF